eukprot:GGOE01004667.1.p4 GENE.GGOE01004667.1~~GGOE01004667.1.p4  ORF type:complete len:101 (-),score=1.08 GGOE01004667.1:582-884(-)
MCPYLKLGCTLVGEEGGGNRLLRGGRGQQRAFSRGRLASPGGLTARSGEQKGRGMTPALWSVTPNSGMHVRYAKAPFQWKWFCSHVSEPVGEASEHGVKK